MMELLAASLKQHQILAWVKAVISCRSTGECPTAHQKLIECLMQELQELKAGVQTTRNGLGKNREMDNAAIAEEV